MDPVAAYQIPLAEDKESLCQLLLLSPPCEASRCRPYTFPHRPPSPQTQNLLPHKLLQTQKALIRPHGNRYKVHGLCVESRHGALHGCSGLQVPVLGDFLDQWDYGELGTVSGWGTLLMLGLRLSISSLYQGIEVSTVALPIYICTCIYICIYTHIHTLKGP